MSVKMSKKVNDNLKNFLIIALVVIIIIGIGIVFFIINNKAEYNNEELYGHDKWKSYEEFKAEYSEYNTEFDIGKNNYYEYENDLFSTKYSSKIGEEHYYKKVEDTQSGYYEDNELYIYLTNNSELEVLNAKIGILYYDQDGNIIDTDSENIYGLERNVQTCNVKRINSKRVKDVKVIVNAMKNDRNKALIEKVKAEVIDADSDKFKVIVTNKSEYTIKSVNGLIVFYNEDDKIVSSRPIYMYDDLSKKSSREEEVYIYNKNYSHYKIFINSVSV